LNCKLLPPCLHTFYTYLRCTLTLPNNTLLADPALHLLPVRPPLLTPSPVGHGKDVPVSPALRLGARPSLRLFCGACLARFESPSPFKILKCLLGAVGIAPDFCHRSQKTPFHDTCRKGSRHSAAFTALPLPPTLHLAASPLYLHGAACRTPCTAGQRQNSGRRTTTHGFARGLVPGRDCGQGRRVPRSGGQPRSWRAHLAPPPHHIHAGLFHTWDAALGATWLTYVSPAFLAFCGAQHSGPLLAHIAAGLGPAWPPTACTPQHMRLALCACPLLHKAAPANHPSPPACITHALPFSACHAASLTRIPPPPHHLFATRAPGRWRGTDKRAGRLPALPPAGSTSLGGETLLDTLPARWRLNLRRGTPLCHTATMAPHGTVHAGRIPATVCPAWIILTLAPPRCLYTWD